MQAMTVSPAVSAGAVAVRTCAFPPFLPVSPSVAPLCVWAKGFGGVAGGVSVTTASSA